MFKNSAEIFAYIKKEDVKLIDVRFTDLPGIQHHFNVPVESFDEAVFTEGLMFDGSSIRGFQSIHESDMKLLPVPESAFIDPFRLEKTLVIIFSVHNPSDNSPYSRDPRGVVEKAVNYLKSTGIADQAFFAPEAEFYVFDAIRFKTDINESYHHIDSYEGAWNTGIVADPDGTPNRGYRTRVKGGYFPVSPTDQYADLRDEMVMELGRSGLQVERSHHEVGTAGQMEINYKFTDILTAGDELMKFKYIIKNVAWEGGKTATFMPKPLFGDNSDCDGRAVITFSRVSLIYPHSTTTVIENLSFEISEGEMVLVMGHTGSGKSSLLRLINGLVPHHTGGILAGEIIVDGKSTRTTKPGELAGIVGIVGQNPLATFVTDTVEDELAFGMESLNFPPEVMRKRVEEALD
ncbi:MAG: hypothetical protein RL381_921, partial [Actinomycetota bacterium]